jgi:hypothetical protein
VSRGKAPPFKQRLQAALEAAKAAGSARLKIKTPDGASYEFDLNPDAKPPEVNDFDRPPNPIRGKQPHR